MLILAGLLVAFILGLLVGQSITLADISRPQPWQPVIFYAPTI